MKLHRVPKGRNVSAWEVAAVEATNNRLAVTELRKALRTALKAYCGTTEGRKAHEAILDATEPEKLRGRGWR